MPNEEQLKNAADELDAHVAEIIKWHFSPETGCPFWLDWAKEQNWNAILPPELLEMAYVDGKPVATVINVARVNVMWVNLELVKQI